MASEIKRIINSKLKYIAMLKDSGRQKTILAELRRGLGKKPGDLPKLWGFTFQDVPNELMSTNGEPSKAEWAIYTSLTLYAYHQQGKSLDDNNMNDSNIRLGTAVRKLVHDDNDTERILNRFNRFATASDMKEAATHLKAIIGLMKAENIKFDYPDLAEDLYRYQFYEGAKSVRLKWGQDFYKALNKKEEKEINE